jgi:hypothetical protein
MNKFKNSETFKKLKRIQKMKQKGKNKKENIKTGKEDESRKEKKKRSLNGPAQCGAGVRGVSLPRCNRRHIGFPAAAPWYE